MDKIIIINHKTNRRKCYISNCFIKKHVIESGEEYHGRLKCLFQ